MLPDVGRIVERRVYQARHGTRQARHGIAAGGCSTAPALAQRPLRVTSLVPVMQRPMAGVAGSEMSVSVRLFPYRNSLSS